MITRQISNGVTASGHAEILPDQDGTLLYREYVTLCLPDGKQVQGTRAYRLQTNDDDEAVLMFFADGPSCGRLFQTFSNETSSIHHCAADIYSSSWTWHTHDFFTITHNVTGPKKSYSINTDYKRRSI